MFMDSNTVYQLLETDIYRQLKWRTQNAPCFLLPRDTVPLGKKWYLKIYFIRISKRLLSGCAYWTQDVDRDACSLLLLEGNKFRDPCTMNVHMYVCLNRTGKSRIQTGRKKFLKHKCVKIMARRCSPKRIVNMNISRLTFIKMAGREI
jgi:hypothetical protein